MKGKQLAILVVLLIALGGAALLLNRRHAATWRNTATSSGGKILDFPLNEVAQVKVKASGAEVNVAKKDDVWTVRERADYPADFDKVSALIRKLWELRPVQDVKIGPSQLGRLELVEPGQNASSGTLVDLKGPDDKRLAGVLLGKKQFRTSDQALGETSGIPAGRYVMPLDGSNRVFLISETLEEAQLKPEQWLSHEFIKVENPKSISVAAPAAGMNWSIGRDNATAPWKLLDAKPGDELDSTNVQSLASLFAHATFADVLAPDTPVAETGLDKPATIRIETFDNLTYELRIGQAKDENYRALVAVKGESPKERTPAADEKPEDKAKLDQEFQARQKQLEDKLGKEQKLQNRPYLIAKSTIDQLLKDRSALMAEKKPLPSPSAAVTSSPAPAKGGPAPKPSGAAPRAVVSPAPKPSAPRRPPG